MIYWAQLFHFYQPPTQTPQGLDKICNESYRPLLEALRQNTNIKATLNINGALLDMLHTYGHRDIILNLQQLGEKGKVDFTGSGKYHPVLPLLPAAERKRQIDLNTASSAQFLGKAYQPKGFFPPDMCYSADILPEVIATGYQWIMLSGIACPASLPADRIYQVESGGQKISVFFRDDALSRKLADSVTTALEFIEQLRKHGEKSGDSYVITAVDVETLGKHSRNWENVYLKAIYEHLDHTLAPRESKELTGIEYKKEEPETICPVCGTKFLLVFSGKLPQAANVTCPKCRAELTVSFEDIIDEEKEQARKMKHIGREKENQQRIKTLTVSELMQEFSPGGTMAPKASSWNAAAADIEAGNPYPLWNNKDNEIHRLQWEHLYLCIEIVNKALECADNDETKGLAGIARELLDTAEYSHHFRWASPPPLWDANFIQLGLADQRRAIVNAYTAINKSHAGDDIKAEYYRKVVTARDVRNRITDQLFVR